MTKINYFSLSCRKVVEERFIEKVYHPSEDNVVKPLRKNFSF